MHSQFTDPIVYGEGGPVRPGAPDAPVPQRPATAVHRRQPHDLPWPDAAGRTLMHPDDEFHPPTSDDPFWTETCWFTFAVPERKLSAQLYPFFRPNQGVCAAAAYAWDDSGDQPWNVRYGKNFWHLPIPDQP